jgi:hypothetical protein
VNPLLGVERETYEHRHCLINQYGLSGNRPIATGSGTHWRRVLINFLHALSQHVRHIVTDHTSNGRPRVLEDWLGLASRPVLGGEFEKLQLFAVTKGLASAGPLSNGRA